MLICPFCNENDFDELGLELHLANWCMGDQSPKLNSLAYRERPNTASTPTSGESTVSTVSITTKTNPVNNLVLNQPNR